MGKFQISKMFDKFLENVAIKRSSPEAAPVSDNSKITDFQESEKLCQEKKNHWTHAFFLEASATCQLLETSLKDLSLTNHSCYYHLLFQKW